MNSNPGVVAGSSDEFDNSDTVGFIVRSIVVSVTEVVGSEINVFGANGGDQVRKLSIICRLSPESHTGSVHRILTAIPITRPDPTPFIVRRGKFEYELPFAV